MMPYGWHDGAWGVLWMILSWGVIVAIVWALIRAFAPDEGDGHASARDPRETLAERYAKGEIDSEEYHQRLRVLEDTDAPTKTG